MIIIDAHLDLSWNALQWGRDLRRSVYTIRTQENTSLDKGRGLGTVAFPEMRQGRVALSFATLLARSTGQPTPHIDFATPAQSYGVARGQLAFYRALEQQGDVRIITDRAGLDQHMELWTAWDNNGATRLIPPLGFVISMEGADPILAPNQLEEWWDAGLRLLGITHYGPGRYAGGTATELGLSGLGPPLLAGLGGRAMVLARTHCSDQAFWQALDRYGGPVIASHNNCRALVPHQRQFDDDQIRAIIARDGVIGAAFDTWMIAPAWVIGPRYIASNPTVTLSHVVDH